MKIGERGRNGDAAKAVGPPIIYTNIRNSVFRCYARTSLVLHYLPNYRNQKDFDVCLLLI